MATKRKTKRTRIERTCDDCQKRVYFYKFPPLIVKCPQCVLKEASKKKIETAGSYEVMTAHPDYMGFKVRSDWDTLGDAVREANGYFEKGLVWLVNRIERDGLGFLVSRVEVKRRMR